MKTIGYKEIREVTLEMAILQNKLMQLGLLKTYKAMHEATRQVGWECAEIIEGKHTTKLACPHGLVHIKDCKEGCAG